MVSRKIVVNLTDEQEALIPTYRKKWRSIQNSVKPTDRDQVTEAINAAYLISDYPKPKILFYNNPLIAIQEVAQIEDVLHYLGRSIESKLKKRVFEHIVSGFKQQLDNRLFIRLRNQTLYSDFPYYSTQDKPQALYFPHTIMRCLKRQLFAELERFNPELEFTCVSKFIYCLDRPAEWASWGCMFDFCISVLKLHHDSKKWQVVQQLIQNCGFLFLYEKVCIVCDRPCKLSFDEENLLHAEGEPALQFVDGYSIYANHGRCLFEIPLEK
ncbi:hypothetical protein H6F74_09790 [Trichocoleus sp. FACHB-90]|uniref:DUF6745 domain-containing protein n=1 Tax=Cyanophyceae TaxID=3028117 RepID=UPI00168991E0|nr:hypothetical protein [Trichocoleus sp. FACHB-90]MBD1926532.1 hypothetical protein [Trichocoleus sp. FACHB-90]